MFKGGGLCYSNVLQKLMIHFEGLEQVTEPVSLTILLERVHGLKGDQVHATGRHLLPSLALCIDGLLAHYAGNFRFGVVTAICLCICSSCIAAGRRQARNISDLETFVLILNVD